MASGKYGPLGWTQGKGAVNIEAVLKNFMCTGQEPAANHGAAESVGVEDNLGAAAAASRNRALQRREDDRSKYCGHSGGSSFFNLPVIGVLGIGGERTSWPVESRQEDYHCAGKDKGLPTADDDGKIYAIYRQVRAILSSIKRQLQLTVPSGQSRRCRSNDGCHRSYLLRF